MSNKARIYEIYLEGTRMPFEPITMRDGDSLIINHSISPKELPQCPKCEVYTDDPEHYCGSVALVRTCNNPYYWKYLALEL